jgi:hypothetical protein
MNNLHRVQNIFISDGSALPANDAAITTVSPGDIGVFGTDMKALNPAGADTISTQPAIYIVEGKTDSDGVNYVKRSTKISGQSVINYTAKPFLAPTREVWSIGHNRKTAVGTIEVNTDTNYNFTIRFKNDKFLYSERPEVLNVNFTSSASATQLTIATQIASSINNSSFKKAIIAVVVGDGTGVYGLTGATDYGVEIWTLDINQFSATTYTPNNVYFSAFVNDASGFGTTTTCTQIQAFSYGNGTYNEVYTIENKDFAYEGVLNRRLWPIPVLDYSSVSATIASSAIAETVTGTISEDTVTFSATVAAILNVGDKVDLGGVVYEIKYFVSTTVAVLTSVLTAGLVAAAVLLKYKYDIINIEYNDSINTPTGVVAVANKSVVIAVPAINSGSAYNTLSTAGTNVKAILDTWMATTPGAFPAISI